MNWYTTKLKIFSVSQPWWGWGGVGGAYRGLCVDMVREGVCTTYVYAGLRTTYVNSEYSHF